MYGIPENSGITIEVLKGLITKRKGFKKFEVNYADLLSIEASMINLYGVQIFSSKVTYSLFLLEHFQTHRLPVIVIQIYFANNF